MSVCINSDRQLGKATELSWVRTPTQPYATTPRNLFKLLLISFPSAEAHFGRIVFRERGKRRTLPSQQQNSGGTMKYRE
ncbi:MAG: hypothetical protein A3F04_01340 [Candidatus Chisholmbacteria bacterium RIFCSPHIGHO2_12_FULL_49_9]|uniref:Uncharacterized protein n=1 Tax=Candidatus Chisholmbacteria bacterium RIFCSPHIGHO2_01_FULL_52_32 TaxID=1797591 RepID=A0A1G1VTJ4_9BACT|nr:MAG: hypothetical protein A2786_04465 [Candidatus Chisholmbacteria bacterium RIFCSPHIGHO2_01_FULL_52_32]OGY19911.1 MAG: hypothetical protein A2900_02280 [Candidatus Chisholmbacteria bacterium RIFCSPLOWO2_01_FULL_50_28]OGY21264.1 MAG: hypothetical protein A3F04_01340 [Candidatus Chisholmbacteria bacterium RIFCSPHIGHO2_12_FULL_49_9]